jgi:hypothetical protein
VGEDVQASACNVNCGFTGINVSPNRIGQFARAQSVHNVVKGDDLSKTCPERSNGKNQTQEEQMRKFWIVLVSIGLIMAIAMPAFAVSGPDIKVSGSYYVVGAYEDNHALTKNTNNSAVAYFFQRLRMQPEFKIAEGLTLVTRFDALESIWGDNTWGVAGKYQSASRVSSGNTNSKVQENIEFERAYVDFNTGIGRFMVGYQDFIAWGTDFLDTHATRPGIKYLYNTGPVTIVAALEQVQEGTVTGSRTPVVGNSDTDKTIYDLGVTFAGKGLDTGVLLQYSRDATTRSTATSSYVGDIYVVDPYVKATFGKFYVEAEGGWMFGKYAKYENPNYTNIDVNAFALYVGAKADFGPAYVGAKFAYISGDDPTTTDKVEGNLTSGMVAGQVFSPMLMMWNDPLIGTAGKYYGNLSGTMTSQDQFMDNCFFYNLYAGFKPTPKLDLMANVAYAVADQKPANAAGPGSTRYISNEYGTEADLTATYKIYDNLSYMVGVGYWWVGDFYKGTSQGNKVDNDYIVLHKLTLSF